jgi:epoxyqueuosine reductase QueG
VHADGVKRPSDYHKVLLKRLKALEARLRLELGEFESRCYVDTGPVVERSLAVAAGLGWTGKNTCLIHPKLGSFGFLAVLLTSLEVEAERASDDSAGPVRKLHTMPGGMPDGSVDCALSDGRDALHFLSND